MSARIGVVWSAGWSILSWTPGAGKWTDGSTPSWSPYGPFGISFPLLSPWGVTSRPPVGSGCSQVRAAWLGHLRGFTSPLSARDLRTSRYHRARTGDRRVVHSPSAYEPSRRTLVEVASLPYRSLLPGPTAPVSGEGPLWCFLYGHDESSPVVTRQALTRPRLPSAQLPATNVPLLKSSS